MQENYVLKIHYHFATTLVSEESDDFDMLVDELLKYNPVYADYQEHKSACNIGIAFYEVLRATRIKEE